MNYKDLARIEKHMNKHYERSSAIYNKAKRCEWVLQHLAGTTLFGPPPTQDVIDEVLRECGVLKG